MKIDKVENGYIVQVSNNDYDWQYDKQFIFVNLDDALSFIKTTIDTPKQTPTT